MRKYAFLFISIVFLFHCVSVTFAAEPFRFALFTDLHINANNAQPAEDLQNAVNDVNILAGIDFVIISGDITQFGDTVSLKKAKQMLEKLNIPYYIIPGNHDVKWNEPGATNFKQIFRDDKFSFSHKGFQFIGFTTAPLTKSDNGTIKKQDIDWMKTVLLKSGTKIPIFVVTHYPLQTGDVDNWFEMTDILRKYNVQAVLGGHYHRNVLLNYDKIPGIICRSTLRAKDVVGSYTIFSISDSIHVFEKKISQSEDLWLAMPIETKKYNQPDTTLRSLNTTLSKQSVL